MYREENYNDANDELSIFDVSQISHFSENAFKMKARKTLTMTTF